MIKYSLIMAWSMIGLLSCSSIKEKVESTAGVKFKKKGPQSLFKYAWIKNLDPNYQTGNLPIALHSPIIKDGVLFAASNKGSMNAYNIYSGRVIWSKRDRGEYQSQPGIYKDALIYGTNQGRLYYRNRHTGKLKYSIDLGSPIESRPVVSKGRLFIHVRGHKIYCLDVETGKILWAYKRSVPYLTTVQRVSTPTIVGNKVVIGFADGHVATLNLEDGAILWETKISTGGKFVDVDMSPYVIGDKVLVGSLAGAAQVLYLDSGRVFATLDYQIARAPYKIGESIVLGTTQGELVFLSTNFKEVKKYSLGFGGVSSVTTWKDYVVVSTVKGHVLFLDSSDFSVLKNVHLGHTTSAIFGKLVKEKDYLAFISSRNRLYVLY